MKALTVQQPWAWAIFHGKDVENRTTRWASLTGQRLAIHAGTRLSIRGLEHPLVIEAMRVHGWDADEDPFPMGVLLGSVLVSDVHVAHAVDPTITRPQQPACCESPWAETSYAEHSTKHRAGRLRRDVVHLVLEDPVPLLEPIRWTGSLGLWDVPDEVMAA